MRLFKNTNIDFMGMQRYFKTDLDYNINDLNKLNISTKRNLLKNSAEFYNLSYQYAIDCFKAGVMFRREFYNDRDIEPVKFNPVRIEKSRLWSKFPVFVPTCSE